MDITILHQLLSTNIGIAGRNSPALVLGYALKLVSLWFAFGFHSVCIYGIGKY